MTKQEFETRTGYKPTAQEFEKINEVYMMVDDDKDTFCMKWKRANRELVAWQKRVAKSINATIEKLYERREEIINSLRWRRPAACSNFDWREILMMEAELVKIDNHISFIQA